MHQVVHLYLILPECTSSKAAGGQQKFNTEIQTKSFIRLKQTHWQHNRDNDIPTEPGVCLERILLVVPEFLLVCPGRGWAWS